VSTGAWLVALPAPADPPPSDALRGALEQALKSLGPEQREVVHLKVYEKMTFPQIAQATGVPANTAASRYRYALTRLRELLAGHLRDER
jgi:RNA polymerase sigma-70 factor (ECF subfamily)